MTGRLLRIVCAGAALLTLAACTGGFGLSYDGAPQTLLMCERSHGKP